MKKLLKYISLLVILLFIVSCGEDTTTAQLLTINLYDTDASLYESFEVTEGQVFSFPEVTRDNFVYVGWNNEFDTFAGTQPITTNLELTLTLENATNVFLVNDGTTYQTDTAVISSYTGAAKYLRIPETLNGLRVIYIDNEAFKSSDLVEVYIPNTVSGIGNSSFEDSESLEKVVFYSELFASNKEVIKKSEFEDYMVEFDGLCDSFTDESGMITYSDTCPIHTAKKTDVLVLNEVEYYNYEIEIDYTDFPELYSQSIGTDAFKNCPKLKTIAMPIASNNFPINAFDGNDLLTDIVYENDYKAFEVIDNVVYSKDLKTLIYYPSGVVNQSFTVPDGVIEIGAFAFQENSYLETIYISEDVTSIVTKSLYNLSNLKEIIVDDDNQVYSSNDGVLYKNTESLNTLLRYPPNKVGNSFEIPTTVDEIGRFAFGFNKSLTSIDLGQITNIADYAFELSESLVILDIPNTVERIGYNTIMDSAITTIILRRDYFIDGFATILEGELAIQSMQDLVIYMPDDSIAYYYLQDRWIRYSYFVEKLSEYDK